MHPYTVGWLEYAGGQAVGYRGRARSIPPLSRTAVQSTSIIVSTYHTGRNRLPSPHAPVGGAAPLCQTQPVYGAEKDFSFSFSLAIPIITGQMSREPVPEYM